MRKLFRLKKENETTKDRIIGDIRNLFRLRNETIKDKIIRDIRNLFRLKKENEAIKDRIIRDIRFIFEQEDDDYKPTRAGNFGTIIISNTKETVIKNKIVSVKEYLNKIKPYLKDSITELKKPGTWDNSINNCN